MKFEEYHHCGEEIETEIITENDDDDGTSLEDLESPTTTSTSDGVHESEKG